MRTAASLLGTRVSAAVLGAAYWWAGSHLIGTEQLGIAAAFISALVLISTLAGIGLGMMLVRELPRHNERHAGLVGAAITVSGVVAAMAALGFAPVASMINPQSFGGLDTPFHALGFAAGTAIASTAVVVDHALLGLLNAHVQLLRNLVFSITKLVFLLVLGTVVAALGAFGVYGTWVVGTVASLAVLAILGVKVIRIRRLEWGLLRALWRSTARHQALEVVLAVPPLALPLCIALIVTPVETAAFYVAWLLASTGFVMTLALAHSLYAHGSHDQAGLRHRAGITLGVAVGGGIVGTVGSIAWGGPILSAFGPDYAVIAGPILPALVAVAIPAAVKDHYQVVCRITDQTARAIPLCALGGALEILFAIIGGALGGFAGIAWGYLVAHLLQAAIMLPALIRVLGTEPAKRS